MYFTEVPRPKRKRPGEDAVPAIPAEIEKDWRTHWPQLTSKRWWTADDIKTLQHGGVPPDTDWELEEVAPRPTLLRRIKRFFTG